VTEGEARSRFLELRLPTYLPEGTVGPAFTVHSVDGLPLVTLHYSYTMQDLKVRGFQNSGGATFPSGLSPAPSDHRIAGSQCTRPDRYDAGAGPA